MNAVEMNRRKVRIVIVDSGIDLSNPLLNDCEIKGCRAYVDDNKQVLINSDYYDDIGHGTAIYSIIHKNAPNALIYNIKAFSSERDTSQEDIEIILKYISENIQCDIINLSLGTTQYENHTNFEKIVNELFSKGILIISAFSNDGGISYPAAFNNVIGVDSNRDIKLSTQFEFIEDSIINIRAKGGKQRVLWKMPEKFAMVEGNSFSAAYMTANIANLIEDNHINKSSINSLLKKNSIKIIRGKKKKKSVVRNFLPQNAIVFPFNKEVHSLVRYSKELSFDMVFYDTKLSGLVGKNTNEIVYGSDYIIKNIEKLDWTEPFDTVILGHVDELSIVLKKDFINYFVDKCIKYKKNLYAFDNLGKYNIDNLFIINGLDLYYPSINASYVPNNSFGKLYYIPVPTICVCGTSSRQGKFTLQLSLRKMLSDDGYKIGQLGTEPSSLLYGMDDVCPYGYGFDFKLNGYPFISAVNNMIYKISEKNPDLIICGTQSGVIPYAYDNLNEIPLHSIHFLMGIRPDAIILCVNHHDDFEYINRTINSLENLLDTKVIALVLYPLTIDYSWQGILLGNKHKLNINQIIDYKSKAKNTINREVFLLGDHEDMRNLKNLIIDYFGD